MANIVESWGGQGSSGGVTEIEIVIPSGLTDAALYVSLGADVATAPNPTVTLEGTPLVQLSESTGTGQQFWVGRLLNPPATPSEETSTLSMTIDSGLRSWNVVLVEDVDQNSPEGTPLLEETGSATSLSGSAIATDLNDLVLSFIHVNNTSGSQISATGSGQSKIEDTEHGSGSAAISASVQVGTGENVTPAWNWIGASRATHIFFAVNSSDSPPIIGSPTPSGTLGTTTTATIGCTTDVSTGTLYAVVDTAANISGITAAQIIAGNNNTNAAAVAANSGVVSTATPSVGVSGLTSNTLYSYAIVQVNDTAQSNVITGTFTTAATAVVATKLMFTTQPANTVVGSVMANVVVAAVDGDDNLDTSFTGDITLALQTGSGALFGTLTKAAVNGVATFNDLGNNTLNTGAVLRATSVGLTLVDSNSFNFTLNPSGSGAGGSLIGSVLIS